MRDELDPNLRLLAPIAVGVFAVAFLVIILTSGAVLGGSSTEAPGSASENSSNERTERRSSRRRSSGGRATYTIEAGDTLGSIASDNDVTVERLQELNPGLDPQALTAGQKIKLRE